MEERKPGQVTNEELARQRELVKIYSRKVPARADKITMAIVQGKLNYHREILDRMLEDRTSRKK